ncbi:MAG: NADH:flavin oxidoreductase/NADH oxidase [Nocardioides sp.]|nr:NADH:flavin oxidoreductase/NADH oxidase [Nocardioides sp.]
MSLLFSPIQLRDLAIKNRAWVSPMCQYSAVDGVPNQWHLVHLGGFAKGGAGLVMAEATAVVPEGRISPNDAGLWNDEQRAAWAPIVDFIHGQGAAAAIQLGHAGRKASTQTPWEGRGVVEDADGGWDVVAPSPIAYPDMKVPHELTVAEIAEVVDAFGAAAQRAVEAGFDVVEIHGAHGYLLQEFLSPLSNRRTDDYGGSLPNRARFLLEVVAEVRRRTPSGMPLLARISGSDWHDDGWSVEDSVELAPLLSEVGADLVDVSSGGNAVVRIPLEPGYQVRFAHAVRAKTGVATGAVGLITEARQAEEILAGGSADVVFLGRALLREPHWPLLAAHELGDDIAWPLQYDRARPRD